MRLVCAWGEKYVNRPADRLTEREGMIFAYDGEKLVGIFDLGAIDMIYLLGETNES